MKKEPKEINVVVSREGIAVLIAAGAILGTLWIITILGIAVAILTGEPHGQ